MAGREQDMPRDILLFRQLAVSSFNLHPERFTTRHGDGEICGTNLVRRSLVRPVVGIINPSASQFLFNFAMERYFQINAV